MVPRLVGSLGWMSPSLESFAIFLLLPKHSSTPCTLKCGERVCVGVLIITGVCPHGLPAVNRVYSACVFVRACTHAHAKACECVNVFCPFFL